MILPSNSWCEISITDLIAIPDFAAGAMENWGLITYRMTAILYDPEVSSANDKEWVAVVVAHELAHQVSVTIVWVKNGKRILKGMDTPSGEERPASVAQLDAPSD